MAAVRNGEGCGLVLFLLQLLINQSKDKRYQPLSYENNLFTRILLTIYNDSRLLNVVKLTLLNRRELLWESKSGAKERSQRYATKSSTPRANCSSPKATRVYRCARWRTGSNTRRP